jgi:glycosyltransferase involved in cell wall biosynthesis
MSILVVTAVFPPEPVVSSKLSFDIASSAFENNEVIVVAPEPSRPFGFKFEETGNEFDFDVVRTNSYICPQLSLFGRLKESYSFGKECCRYISDNRSSIKLIYANAWPLLAQFYIVKTAKKYNIPVVMHIQDIYPESLTNKLPFGRSLVNFFLLPIDRYVLRNANKVIAISEKMKDYLVKTRIIDKEKVAVVYNWQDEKPFIEITEQGASAGNNCFTFMYLGNIGPVAGVDLLIEAFILAEIPNSRLVIAGSGTMKEMLEKKARQFTTGVIEFWPVPDGKVPETQGCADVLLLPIKAGAAESSVPSKLCAYMFSAKPIIASADSSSDISLIVNSANCGWVVSPENVKELSEKMRAVSNMDVTDLKNAGQNGQKYAMQYFSKKSNLNKITKILEETVSE